MSTTLFNTPGLNRYSTPCPRSATPSDIDQQFRRPSFNGTGWPRDSPVAQTYDVRNSTTKMILLNNSSKSPKLRGYRDSKGTINHPDSARHTIDRPRVNRDAHLKCLNSETPVFVPEPNVQLGWYVARRPPNRFANGSSVNSRRHTSCMMTDDTVLLWKRPRHKIRCHSAQLLRDSSVLKDLTRSGERDYLMSIARVYSVENLRRIKQHQCDQILRREEHKGVYNTKQCDNYQRYLHSSRKTQSGPGEYRARSAPPLRGQESRRTGHESGHRGTISPAKTKKKGLNETKTSKSETSLDKKNTKSSRTENNRPATCKASKKTKTKSTSAKSKPSSEKNETTTKKGTTSSDKDETKTYVEVESDDTKTEAGKTPKADDSAKDSDSDDPTELTHMHFTSPREGHGRPMSRLGRGSIDRSKEEVEVPVENNDSDFSSESSDSESTRGTEKREKKPAEVEKTSEDKPDDKETKVKRRSDGRGGEGDKTKSEDDNMSKKSAEIYSDDFSDDEDQKQQKTERVKHSSSGSSSSGSSSARSSGSTSDDSATERSTTQGTSTHPEKSVVTETSENTANKISSSSDSSSSYAPKQHTTDESTAQNHSSDNNMTSKDAEKTSELSKDAEKTPEQVSSNEPEEKAFISRQDSLDLKDGKPKNVNEIEY